MSFKHVIVPCDEYLTFQTGGKHSQQLKQGSGI